MRKTKGTERNPLADSEQPAMNKTAFERLSPLNNKDDAAKQ
jgi:hypothetical protein